MIAPPDVSRDSLLSNFEAATIDPRQFDHRAHIEVAWRYLDALPALTAADRMASGLKRITASLGQPGKYHETVTAFLVLLIAERRRQRPVERFDSFCRQNPDLLTDARGLLLKYYSPNRLDSDVARSQFLLPDRSPCSRDPDPHAIGDHRSGDGSLDEQRWGERRQPGHSTD